MFLAQIVFSFRSLCLKTVVTHFVLPGTRGEEESGAGVCWLGVINTFIACQKTPIIIGNAFSMSHVLSVVQASVASVSNIDCP